MARWFSRRQPRLPPTTLRNIRSVAQIEQQFLRRRSPIDCFSDAISTFAGSVWFIIAHVFLFAGWIALNSLALAGFVVFDPYPFVFLNLIVALETVFLSTFVLMSQNRQNRQAEEWSHLDLQVSMLAEQEATKMLQLLRAICDHLGLEHAAGDPELHEMIEKTHVDVLVDEMEKARETDSGGRPAPAPDPADARA